MQNNTMKKPNKRRILPIIISVIIPLTVTAGIFLFIQKKYLPLSLIIIFCAMLPFAIIFERKKPQARQLVTIAVFCGIAVAGRIFFAPFPQIKPIAAVIILAGIILGPETGFLVGAISGFVSNFYFGQGLHTPWQMFGFGLIGFLAGLLFRKAFSSKKKLSVWFRILISIFGGLSVFVIYGIFVNIGTFLAFTVKPTWQAFSLYYLASLQFDALFASSTAVFLYLISAITDELQRITNKFGLRF